MEIVRHQGAQLAKGGDAPASSLKGEMRGVLRHVCSGGGFLDGGPRGGQPSVHAFDEMIWGHAQNLVAVFRELQAETRKSAITAGLALRYAACMPFDPEKIRRAARRIMREKGLKMSTWAKKAGKGERTFAEFLNGSTASPRVETIYRFAEAAGVDVAELLGIEPVIPTISAGAFRAMMALLERVEREQADSGEALQSIRELAAAIASELHPER